MSEPAPVPEQPFYAYELYPHVDTPLDPAPINRDWMDSAHQRHPYRCLPLNIANQNGWVLRSPAGFRAYWYGGANKEDVELQFDGPVDNRIVSHFGSGVITFTVSLASPVIEELPVASRRPFYFIPPFSS